jgi:hypothetical protein
MPLPETARAILTDQVVIIPKREIGKAGCRRSLAKRAAEAFWRSRHCRLMNCLHGLLLFWIW